MDKKIAYLRKFSPNIELVRIGDLNKNEIDTIPSYWKNALSESIIQNRVSIILSEWGKYDYQFLSTYNYLIDKLLDIDLIKHNGSLSLLYSIQNSAGNIAYYEGKNPYTKNIPKKILDQWDKIPDNFRDIYNNLHNGWCYFASQSNGLSFVENLFLLDEMDWGILEELDIKKMPFNLKNCIPFFSNGMGAYVCYDLNSSNDEQGFIWYHDKSPKLDIEIWPVIDEWTKMSIEN
jgi:hypothetical protein